MVLRTLVNLVSVCFNCWVLLLEGCHQHSVSLRQVDGTFLLKATSHPICYPIVTQKSFGLINLPTFQIHMFSAPSLHWVVVLDKSKTKWTFYLPKVTGGFANS